MTVFQTALSLVVSQFLTSPYVPSANLGVFLTSNRAKESIYLADLSKAEKSRLGKEAWVCSPLNVSGDYVGIALNFERFSKNNQIRGRVLTADPSGNRLWGFKGAYGEDGKTMSIKIIPEKKVQKVTGKEITLSYVIGTASMKGRSANGQTLDCSQG